MTGLPDSLRWIVAGWAIVVGAVVGSFLNVVIARVPAGESIVQPRSRCPSCRTPIAWHDNVPVISWILLRARCRACRARIAWRYPLVEVLAAGAAWLAVSRHGLSFEALAEFALAATLLALAFIDLDTWTLPLPITLPLLGAGLLLSALHLTRAGSLALSAAGAATGWILFALVAFFGERVLRKEALGLGDVWLLSAIGAWMGLAPLLPVILLASLQGTVVGIALIVLGKAQPGAAAEAAPAGGEEEWVPPRNAVPFGPFLAAGALEWLWLQGWITRIVPSMGLFT